jgi:hypothetical protein
MLLGAALMLVGNQLWQRHENPPTTSDRLRKTLFQRDRKTLVVLGDAGLNLYTNLARREVDIEDYARQNYLHTLEAETPPGFAWAPFATRRYIISFRVPTIYPKRADATVGGTRP